MSTVVSSILVSLDFIGAPNHDHPLLSLDVVRGHRGGLIKNSPSVAHRLNDKRPFLEVNGRREDARKIIIYLTDAPRVY